MTGQASMLRTACRQLSAAGYKALGREQEHIQGTDLNRYLDQRLKLRHFRIIEAIGEHSSLLKASVSLGIAQPALTRSLQEIEDILGVKLYDRHAKGVRETPFGEALTATARRVLAELKLLDGQLDQLARNTSVVVTLGALPVAAVGIMPGVIARLNETRDDLQIRLVQGLSEQLIPELNAGNIDLIVGRLYPPSTSDGLVRETLYHEPISLIGHPDHPIFAAPGPTQARIARTKLVLPTVTTRIGQEIDQLLTQMGIDLQAPIRSSSLGFIREMIQAKEFVTIMPSLMLAGDLLRGAIKLAPLPIGAPPRPAGLLYRGDKPLPPSALALIDALRSYVDDAVAKTATEV